MLQPQENPERDELRAKFTAWLETVVKRAKLDYVRKQSRQPDVVSLDEILESFLVIEDAEDYWLREFREPTPYDFEEERLAKDFMELPLKRRQVMELLFFEYISEEETAKRLNCSLQYVRNQRYIALKKCAPALRKVVMKIEAGRIQKDIGGCSGRQPYGSGNYIRVVYATDRE